MNGIVRIIFRSGGSWIDYCVWYAYQYYNLEVRQNVWLFHYWKFISYHCIDEQCNNDYFVVKTTRSVISVHTVIFHHLLCLIESLNALIEFFGKTFWSLMEALVDIACCIIYLWSLPIHSTFYVYKVMVFITDMRIQYSNLHCAEIVNISSLNFWFADTYAL